MGTYLARKSAVELAPVTSSVASMSHIRFVLNSKAAMTVNVADPQTVLKIAPRRTKRYLYQFRDVLKVVCCSTWPRLGRLFGCLRFVHASVRH